MASALRCARCGQTLIGEGCRHLGKTYCNSCYDIVIAELLELEKAKEQLFQYIKSLFGEVEIPSDVITSIDYSMKSGKKIKGIEATIYYYYEIMGHEANNINLVGKVIREEYENARKYAEDRQKIMEINQQVDINVPPINCKIERPKSKNTMKYRMEDL